MVERAGVWSRDYHIFLPKVLHWKLTITELVLKWARGINEQLLKTPGADVLSSRKNSENPTMWGGNHRPPLPAYP